MSQYQHFLIDHKAPCLSPLQENKSCITIVFHFSWDVLHNHCLRFDLSRDECITQEKLETMVMHSFSGEYKVHYGLCENDEYQHERAY